MNPEYLGTYGLPVLQDPNKIYTLHVETPKEKWYESLWNAIRRFAKKVRRKIKSAIVNVQGLYEYCRIRLLIKVKGKDYVARKLQKQIEEELIKPYMRTFNFDIKLEPKKETTPEERQAVLSECIRLGMIDPRFAERQLNIKK